MATNGDLARRLLAAAENDKLMAKSVLPVPGVTDAGVGMLAQQAVEKAIKAVLAAKETEFPFIHDLEKLRAFAKESGIELHRRPGWRRASDPIRQQRALRIGNTDRSRPRPSDEVGH